ncbi:MAG: hypothetical protein LYZ66_05010 [Nitrososphaerales archaeon]|nr:hypothetical protein [Nitrososphaerales archaeon]
MELKPAKGLKVKVNAQREVVFGDESVDVRPVRLPGDGGRVGILTGANLAGYCEVEMPSFDGKKHWYPIEGLVGEKGEKLVEEEIQIDVEEGAEEDEADE